MATKLLNLTCKLKKIKIELLQRNAPALLSFTCGVVGFFFCLFGVGFLFGWVCFCCVFFYFFFFKTGLPMSSKVHQRTEWTLRPVGGVCVGTGSERCGPGRRGPVCDPEHLCELDGAWSCSTGMETSHTALSV